jgi:hypothetical protein
VSVGVRKSDHEYTVTSFSKQPATRENFPFVRGECVYYLNGCCGKGVQSYVRLTWEGLRTKIQASVRLPGGSECLFEARV